MLKMLKVFAESVCMLKVFATVLLIICSAGACTKEEYAALFGSTYILSGSRLPHLRGDILHATVTYEGCGSVDDSKFEALQIVNDEMGTEAEVFRIVRTTSAGDKL